MVVEDEVNWPTMEVANESRTRGTMDVPTILDPPRAGGVRVVPRADKERSQTASIVAGRAKKRVLEEDCYSDKSESSKADVERRQRSHYTEGIGRVRVGLAFVMKHKANSMAVNSSRSNGGFECIEPHEESP